MFILDSPWTFLSSMGVRESRASWPKWRDEWTHAKMPTLVRLRVVAADGTEQPETMVRVMLSEEAGCLENTFQRSCRPRRP